MNALAVVGLTLTSWKCRLYVWLTRLRLNYACSSCLASALLFRDSSLFTENSVSCHLVASSRLIWTKQLNGWNATCADGEPKSGVQTTLTKRPALVHCLPAKLLVSTGNARFCYKKSDAAKAPYQYLFQNHNRRTDKDEKLTDRTQ